jgi:predicted SnoaL-like aldol condensation-catalyzing enzyme
MANNDDLEKNKAIVKKIVEIFADGDISEINSIVSPNYIDHQGLPGITIRGQAGFKQVVMVARKSAPDLRVDIMDLISEGNKVVVRLQWHGTGHSGKRVDRETIDIIRLLDGQMVEHWGAEEWSSEGSSTD